jgi:hypothetical protein
MIALLRFNSSRISSIHSLPGRIPPIGDSSDQNHTLSCVRVTLERSFARTFREFIILMIVTEEYVRFHDRFFSPVVWLNGPPTGRILSEVYAWVKVVCEVGFTRQIIDRGSRMTSGFLPQLMSA